MLDKLDKFHRTRSGYALFAAVELALAYVFISWAIDSGSWLDYAFALLFTVGFLQNFIRFILSFFGSKKRRGAVRG